MRVCSSLRAIGINAVLGLRLGGILVVRGAGGVGGGLADNKLLSAPLGIELPANIEHLVGAVDLGLPPGRP